MSDLKGNIVNLLEHDIDIEPVTIAPIHFVKPLFLDHQENHCVRFCAFSTDNPDITTSLPCPSNNFLSLVSPSRRPPVFSVIDPQFPGEVVDIMTLGFHGLMNNNFALFKPRNLPKNSRKSSSGKSTFWHKVIPRTDKYSNPKFNTPTYYIVSPQVVRMLQDSKYCADPKFFLVPIKLEKTDKYFAGFVPARFFLPKKN